MFYSDINTNKYDSYTARIEHSVEEAWAELKLRFVQWGFKKQNTIYLVTWILWLSFPSFSYCRLYTGFSPSMLIFDQELISQVMVKQFDNFTNREVREAWLHMFEFHHIYSIILFVDWHWMTSNQIRSCRRNWGTSAVTTAIGTGFRTS